jgi:hypothetical protein
MVVENIFQHKLMKAMLSTFMSNLLETKHNHLIFENIKTRVSTHLANGYIPKHIAVKELLGTLVIITLVVIKHASGRMVAKNLKLFIKCVY